MQVARIHGLALTPGPWMRVRLGSMADSVHHGNDRERVLDATDIVDLIGEHLTLTPKGREFVAVCPFHDDHRPSMYVVPHKQIYHCFSCGAGGNAIDFVVNFHRMEFIEALRFLAERAGIELQRRRRPERTVQREDGTPAVEVSNRRLVELNQMAADFFRTIYRSDAHGQAVRGVIESRGITPEMVDLFEIGAAPDRWDGLITTLQRRGVVPAELHAAGLALPRKTSAGYYDGFRNRLMFPIHDQAGRIVAFGGRQIDPDDEPKYRNSPETAVFNKSSILFGLHQARAAIVASRTAVVTEGYTDVIACHQAGIGNVVATLGTALTNLHARVLRRMCDTVILLFDGDEAGQRAADRALEVFFAEPLDVKIAILPDNLDPDDLLKQEGGRERFDESLETAVDALAYHARRCRARMQGLGASARASMIEQEIDRFSQLGLARVSPVRRGLIFKNLAQLLGVDESALRLHAKRAAARPAAAPSDPNGVAEAAGPGGAAAQDLRSLAESEVLGCILVDPRLFRGKSPDPGLFLDTAHRDLAAKLFKLEPGEVEQLMLDMEDPVLRACAVRAYARTDRMTGGDQTRLRATYAQSMATLKALREPTPDETTDRVDTVLERLSQVQGPKADPAALPRPT
jgi:DNA primase